MKLNFHGIFNPQPHETYIGLINIDRIPYHLLVVSGGKQFSWEVRKSRIGEDFKTLIRHLEARKTRCVFFRISEDPSIIEKVNQAYSTPEFESTCIGPILKLINSLGVEFKNEPLTIFELMDELAGADFHFQAFGLNIERVNFELREYSRTEVDEHISQLLGELLQ